MEHHRGEPGIRCSGFWLGIFIVSLVCLAGTPNRPGLIPALIALLEGTPGDPNAKCELGQISGVCEMNAKCTLMGSSGTQCTTCDERENWTENGGDSDCACYSRVKSVYPPEYDFDGDGNLDPWTATTCANAGGYWHVPGSGSGTCYRMQVPGKTQAQCTSPGHWHDGKCWTSGCTWF